MNMKRINYGMTTTDRDHVDSTMMMMASAQAPALATAACGRHSDAKKMMQAHRGGYHTTMAMKGLGNHDDYVSSSTSCSDDNNNNNNNDNEYSSISSSSPSPPPRPCSPMAMSMAMESAQFSLELRGDAAAEAAGGVGAVSVPSIADSGCSPLTYSSCSSNSNSNSNGDHDHPNNFMMSMARNNNSHSMMMSMSRNNSHSPPQIVRPGNPSPPSSNCNSNSRTSSSSGSTSASPRSSAKSSSSSTSSSSPSLLQMLLKRSRRHRNRENRPPSKIYLPMTHNNHHGEGEIVGESNSSENENENGGIVISPLMLPQSAFNSKRAAANAATATAAQAQCSSYSYSSLSSPRNEGSNRLPEFIMIHDDKRLQARKQESSTTSHNESISRSQVESSTAAVAAAQLELEQQCQQLQTKITCLQTQQRDLQAQLKTLDLVNNNRTESTRFDILRILAICGGDAKHADFVSFVNEMERSKNERKELVCKLEEVTRGLDCARDELKEGLKLKLNMNIMNNYSLSSVSGGCTTGTTLLSRPALSSSSSMMLIPKMTPLPTSATLPTAEETKMMTPPSSSSPASPSPPSSASSIMTSLEGKWFTLTKPTYPDCLGVNDEGNPMYTLGRMSFEMFRPGNLVLSIEAVFNPIMEVVGSGGAGGGAGGEGDEAGNGGGSGGFSVPKTLQEEVRGIMEDNGGSTGAGAGEDNGTKSVLRTYHIVTAFQIEPYCPSFGPNSPNALVQQPIKGIMTTYGYALPDPENPERLSVWFSGGKMECGEKRNSEGFEVWKKIFRNEEEEEEDEAEDKSEAGGTNTFLNKYKYKNKSKQSKKKKKKSKRKRRRTFREGVMVAAARLLMGADGYNDDMDEKTGTMAYTFSRPVGGHSKAYVDILHLDDHTRVMRGHAGTLYVFTRLGGNK